MRTAIAVKWATALTFVNSFVIVEEFVIDRHGLSQYLPFYRVGQICVYDILAVSLAIGFVVAWQRRDNQLFGR